MNSSAISICVIQDNRSVLLLVVQVVVVLVGVVEGGDSAGASCEPLEAASVPRPGIYPISWRHTV
jgi:hypothetical protein